MLLIELIVTIVAVLASFTLPRLWWKAFERIESFVYFFSARHFISALSVGLLAIALRTLLLPIVPIPDPGIPDEFGHLLAADTFSHGRFTNSTPEMWKHLQNLCVIQKPTYMSKYPPAQGVILAIGTVLFGHPFWGVCLSIGIMCTAICWMLQGWVPPHWALVGGVLSVIRLGTFSYWANSYWGGAVAATGGALVVGALPRVKASHSIKDVLLMGVGFLILAMSRPYEGLVLSICVLAFLCASIARLPTILLLRTLRLVALPLFASFALTLCVIGYYSRHVTGSWYVTPYQVAQRTYYPTPVFIWQRLRPVPDYDDPVIKDSFEQSELPVYTLDRQHPLLTSAAKSIHLWLFFVGPLLSLPFVAIVLILPYGFSLADLDSGTRELLIIAACSFIAVLLALRFNPGYAAPFAAVIYALLVKVMRGVRHGTQRRDLGVTLSRTIVSGCILLFAVRVAAGPLHIPLNTARTWCSRDFQLNERASIESTLSQLPGEQLVIVRYPASHPSRVAEWVFNGADLATSKVIWARDLGDGSNSELINFYKKRTPWLLRLDHFKPELLPYFIREGGETGTGAEPANGRQVQ